MTDDKSGTDRPDGADIGDAPTLSPSALPTVGLARSSAPPLPDRIGRYKILGVLGEGGMGVVYEAVQRALGRRVALKVLRPGSASLPTARARFEREARVAAALKHPSAVAIHDFGQDAGLLYLAMELLGGTTLRDVVDRGSNLPVGRLLDVASQVASVLVEAHAIGLVHRDLKPGNIFLEPGQDARERVVVADFGLAFIQDSD